MKNRPAVVERSVRRHCEKSGGKLAPHEILGFEHFGMNDLERRNLGIPFQQCGHACRSVRAPGGTDSRQGLITSPSCVSMRYVPQSVWPAKWHCTTRWCGTERTYSNGSNSWLTLETNTLFTSSNKPQSASSAMRLMNSHSDMVEAANVT